MLIPWRVIFEDLKTFSLKDWPTSGPPSLFGGSPVAFAAKVSSTLLGLVLDGRIKYV